MKLNSGCYGLEHKIACNARCATEAVSGHRRRFNARSVSLALLAPTSPPTNTAGADVFPETQSQIDHLKAQISQSELIVAAHEKGTAR
jgi:hypothetical protein